MTMRYWAVVLFLALIAGICPAGGSALFYEGGIAVDEVTIYMDAGPSSATVVAEYLLVNIGSAPETVSVQAAGDDAGPAQLALAPGARRVVVAEYQTAVTGGAVRTLALDPALLFDGRPSAGRVGTMSCAVALPRGVPGILSANRDFVPADTTDKRSVYAWTATDVYPTRIVLKWSTSGMALAMEKSVTPPDITRAGEELTVSVAITNAGSSSTPALVLRDTFPEALFEGVSPQGEFGRGDNESGPRLTWERTAAPLQPGESRTETYRIRYTGDPARIGDITLGATTAEADGSLVAASSPVTLRILIGATRVPFEGGGAPPETTPTPVPVWGAVAAVALGALLLRRTVR